jgi:hypothetical protein
MRSLFLSISDIAEGEKVDRYVSGLLPHLQKEVLLKDPVTLEDAIRIATRHDALSHSVRLSEPLGFYTRERSAHASQPKNGNGHGNGRVQESDDAMENGHGDPMELGAMELEPKCYNCGKRGHRMRECAEPQKKGKGRDGPWRRPRPSH